MLCAASTLSKLYQSATLLFFVVQGPGLSENNCSPRFYWETELSGLLLQAEGIHTSWTFPGVSVFLPLAGEGTIASHGSWLCVLDARISQTTPGNSCPQTQTACHHRDNFIFRPDLQIKKAIAYCCYVMSF